MGQEVPLDDSRRERPSRRGQWEAEREADDQARQMTGRSDPSRGYADKREVSRYVAGLSYCSVFCRRFCASKIGNNVLPQIVET